MRGRMSDVTAVLSYILAFMIGLVVGYFAGIEKPEEDR